MGRAYSCWMLNWRCITWPVNFKSLSMLENRVLGGIKTAKAVGRCRISGQRKDAGASKFITTNVNTILSKVRWDWYVARMAFKQNLFWSGNLKEVDNLRPRVDGRVILKWILRYDVWKRSELHASENGPVTGYYGNRNQISYSIIDGNILKQGGDFEAPKYGVI